jgi:diadenosine tetraphosphate (Ap4A) HIT family hydrolase
VTDWRADRIASAQSGDNPTVLRRLPEGFAVMGDPQWLPGYCPLLTDDAAVGRLSDLPLPRRDSYLRSLAILAEAVEVACQAADHAFRRVNIEILGNTDPYLHAHVWPRYGWEPPELVGGPVWLYPVERWDDQSTALGPRQDGLRAAIVDQLDRAMSGS